MFMKIMQQIKNNKVIIKNILILILILILLSLLSDKTNQINLKNKEIEKLSIENSDLRDFYYQNVKYSTVNDFTINADYNKRQNTFYNLKVGDKIEKEYYSDTNQKGRDAQLLLISDDKNVYRICFTSLSADNPCEIWEYNLGNDKYKSLGIAQEKYIAYATSSVSLDKKNYTIVTEHKIYVYSMKDFSLVLTKENLKGELYGNTTDFPMFYPDYQWTTDNKLKVNVYDVNNSAFKYEKVENCPECFSREVKPLPIRIEIIEIK